MGDSMYLTTQIRDHLEEAVQRARVASEDGVITTCEHAAIMHDVITAFIKAEGLDVQRALDDFHRKFGPDAEPYFYLKRRLKDYKQMKKEFGTVQSQPISLERFRTKKKARIGVRVHIAPKAQNG
jgi:hypothetical protein